MPALKPDEKTCSQCAETIKLDAKVCRHCGHAFSDQNIAEEKQARETARRKKGALGFGAVAAVVVLLAAIGSVAGGSKSTTSNTSSAFGSGGTTLDQTGENLEDMATNVAQDAGTSAGKTVPAIAENWTYRLDKDEMRGSTSRYAVADSNNSLDLAFPYAGGNHGHLHIRKRASDGLNVFLTIDQGQILCNDYSGHNLHVKIDSGPVRVYGCSNASDGSNSVAFPGRILAALRGSKRVVIEANIYEAGSPQLKFNTAGLQWK